MGKYLSALRRFSCVLVTFLGSLSLVAQTFNGTNAPGTGTNFSFSIPGTATNLSLTLPGTATAYSHLLLRKGSAPTDTAYDFISQINLQTNSINLELPEFSVTNYFARVRTPSGSLTHSFSLLVESNRTDLRSITRPVMKPFVSTNTGVMAPGTKQFFRVEVPTNASGWRILLDSTSASPDVYVQRGQAPTETSYLKRSVAQTNDIIGLTDVELIPGAYFIGVFSTNNAPANLNYTLRTETLNVSLLSWDPGTTHLGTEVYSNTATAGGDFYFKIRTQNPALGAWRSALNVVTGEAAIYLSKSILPSTTQFDFKSDRVGSDGFVLASTQFLANEDWYILVRAATNSQWTLVSGAPFVTDLGNVAADASSSSGSLPMGPEGLRFFQTSVPADTLAWRLWLNGGSNSIYLKKTSVPLPLANELTQAGQMLVVPGYLTGGQLYFIAVAGAPGTNINLDSRQQAVSDISFSSSTNVSVTGYGYQTFRVQVPAAQIAWQVNVSTTNGNPNVAVRGDLVPNENNNDAFSEVPGVTTDSITLVPPPPGQPGGLSDGTFFITVYSTSATTNLISYTLQSGPPVVTDINYTTTITNNDTNRVGWRFYRVDDISQQLGSLGWDLFITNFSPGTRIALRRNAVPGIWTSRNPNLASSGFHDFLSAADFLQRPGHQADIWYIGIYNPTNVLGAFTLITRELSAQQIAGDGGSSARSSVLSGKWEYFRVDVPTNVFGWDLRLINVTSGLPRISVRREALPSINPPATALSVPGTATNWLSGLQWSPTTDWTRRSTSADGLINEDGRVLAMGTGRPLQSGIYYIGVINTQGTNAMSYQISSRFIGDGQSIPVTNLSYVGGIITNLSLAPRHAAYYRVTIPANMPSWKVRLTPIVGEVMLVVSTNGLPNIESEKRVQKNDKEHYVMLPPNGQSVLRAGDYYLAVVSEGQTPASAARIGTNDCSYVIESIGPLPEIQLGTLDNDLVYPDQLEGGEVRAFRFSTLPGLLGFEILVDDPKVGNPTAVSAGEFVLPDPGLGGDLYGNEGGSSAGVSSPHIINVANPYPEESVVIKARGTGFVYPDATYTLRIKKFVPAPLAFDGTTNIVAQPNSTWKFFRVDVPPTALGWDVRLTNVLSGDPQIAIARDFLPISLTTSTGFTPASATNWDSGERWAADDDWTGRSFSADNSVNEDGRILAMGMKRPLQSGTYYIGVSDGGGSADMTYTLVSRGIGDGFAIPVQELNFTGGTANITDLPARETAYFKVQIPPNTSSWKVKLSGTGASEMLMVALRDAVPNILAGSALSATNGLSAGRKMQKTGDEEFLLLPSPGQTNLITGTYYLVVASEGQSPAATRIGTGASSFNITSVGVVPIVNLGTLSTVDLVQNGSADGGETIVYQFTVLEGTLSMEARLENRVGNPVMVMRPGSRFPDPGVSGGGLGLDSYGNEGGENLLNDVNATFLSVANPIAGNYFVAVKARLSGTTIPDSTYTLRLKAIGTAPLNFDGGFVNVTNQPSGNWKYFAVTVPTNAQGWDVRLTNVTAGLPRFVIRRDALPGSLLTTPWNAPGTTVSWPSSNQWAAASDWTRRAMSSDGLINEDGRILAMGMGRPLEPGNYTIGVINNITASTNAMSYTLVSRGIGNGFSIPLTDLPFNGSATNLSLPARDAAYFRVVVPTNTPSWKVKLAVTSGEAMLVGLTNRLPNVDSVLANTIGTGKAMQKTGNEHYVMLPTSAVFGTIPSGTNYFAVISEGINPSSGPPPRIGTGSSSFILSSLGTLPIDDLGFVSSVDLERQESLEAGETKAYQFTVSEGTVGVEVRLEDRIGNPVMVLRPGGSLPDPGGAVAPVTTEFYGNEGGLAPTDAHSTLITIPNPTNTVYTLMVKARALSPNFSAANYHLRIREVLTPQINFTQSQNTNGLTNRISGLLEDNQRAFFQVEVPDSINGLPVLGWKLDLSQSSGLASVRVRKDFLPDDGIGMPFTTASAVIVPTYLTNGIWFVEVKGSNSTAFTLTSSLLELKRPAWLMPAPGDTNIAPGLTLPYFGDTGIETNGLPIEGDQSLFLQQGYSDYYAVVIPSENSGVLRAELQAVSGNPDLYLRVGSAPTLSHNTTGTSGTVFDRSMTALTTEYANWVPMDGKTEIKLKPGLWYLAVKAAGSANARYRLRVSTGNIQDISLNGANLPNQIVAGGDWRYYRLQMPTTVPLTWKVSFVQQSGDVFLYLRDTVPPGNGVSGTSYRDWSTDLKNSGPYPSYDAAGTYSFTIPPTRPGHVYYLGFRGVNDATFTVTTATNAVPAAELPLLDFYTGTITTNLPGNSQVTFRIDVPAEATRFKYTSLHTTNLTLYLEQGTLPVKGTGDDIKSTGTNSFVNQYLLTAWPWVPSQSYYLTVTNMSAFGESFSITMNGRNAATDDNDTDAMPDAWELQYFGNLNQTATADFDADGINNLLEFQENTNPADKTSFRPRLITAGVNGSVTRDPNLTSYPMGSVVTLSALPNAGYAFVKWTNQASGSDNPLLLVMDTNKTVTALFKVIGDDFSIRVPINNAASTNLGTNIGATKEPGEPNHAGNAGGKSIWWTWTAPASAPVLINATSTFTTLLGVYTGSSVSNLTLVGATTNPIGGTNRVSFNAVAGTAYQIAVDGSSGAAGNITLKLTMSNWSSLSGPTMLGNGSFQFSLQGEANKNYFIDASTNLVNWIQLNSVTTSGSGAVQFIDAAAPNFKNRFYRVRSQ